MPRLSTCIALTAASLVMACGQYTNFPARIHPSGESNLVAEVSYAIDATKTTATVKNPKLVLMGEPGSVGATFDKMTIQYQGVPANFEPKQVTLNTAVRVDSSHRFEKANDVTVKDSPGKLLIGKGTIDLPIISGSIVTLGSPNNTTGSVASQVSATIVLSGTDDAGWPVYVDLGVPINFIRNNP